MGDIHKLATMLKELDDNLVTCMRCGMCQAVCPVFTVSGKEGDVTRGKLALLDALASEMAQDPDGVDDKLNRCLMCGTCQANCPSGVKVMDIFFKARTILAGYKGLSPLQKALFHQIMTRPRLFNNLIKIGSKFQGIIAKPASEILGTSCARFKAPVIEDRHFPRLAEIPLSEQIHPMDEIPGMSGLKVAFFPGCMADKVYPNIALASIKALHHHGVGVFMPEGQACCGIPALSNGDMDGFEKMVVENVTLFEKSTYKNLVTPCATCTATIKELWPEMVRDPKLKARAKLIADSAMDISQFLVDVIGVKAEDMGPAAHAATYHDPCHLKNSLGVTSQPREILKASGTHGLAELAKSSCCGCGGSFTLKHPDLSSEIGGQKAEEIMSTGADVAATSCPACMMQLSDQLSRKNANMSVRHVIEIYADSLG